MRVASYLYDEKEPDIDSSLKNLSEIVDPKFGLISSLKRVRQYYDEPKFWYYSAILNSRYAKQDGKEFHTQASGVSFFSEKLALLKCLGESVERYCNFVYFKETTSFTGLFKQIKDKAIDPNSFVRFSEKQLQKKEFAHFRISENSKFRWTKCTALTNRKFVLVPSQLIYLSYPFLEGEPMIYPVISTGVAGGGCLSAALVRGIYEVVERDSFMIYYLNKLRPLRVQLELIRDEKIQKLLEIAARYKLEIMSLDITTDLDIPVIISIVINRTGLGKAISVGLKSDFNLINALIGSIEEAFHTRSWLRTEYEKNPRKVESSDLLRHSDIKSRGLLWYPDEAIKNLDFWIQNPKRRPIPGKYQTLFFGEQLENLIKIFKKSGYDIYYKDLIAPSLRKLQYHIIKVIVPQIQPLYLNEKYPLFGGERLYNVPKRLGYTSKMESEFNKYPHPFL